MDKNIFREKKSPARNASPASNASRSDAGWHSDAGREEISSIEEPIEVTSKAKETIEKEKNLTSEEIKELREKIEKTDLDDSLKAQVQSHVSDLNSLGLENKLKKLLEIAKVKGVIFAVGVAKKMNDPYLLDTLHDSLVKEGYYKKFKT